MLHQEDFLLFVLLIPIVIILLIRLLLRNLYKPIEKEFVDRNDEIVQLLEQEGYTTLKRKFRIPIIINQEGNIFESRYFIDAIAEKNGLRYVVKVSRARNPLTFSGSAIRDQLLPFFLLGKWDGLLYIDREEKKIYTFTFELELFHTRNRGFFIINILFFLLGIIVALILL